MLLLGVGQPARWHKSARFAPKVKVPALFVRVPCAVSILPLWVSDVRGVGHPVQSVPDVRSTDARRRERDGPESVVQGFQVNLYKVEPRFCVFARNLLSNDRCRLALLNEVVKGGPEMPLIIKPAAFTCRAERLARATSCPDRLIVGPSGLSQGVTPDPDPGKEVALGVPLEFVWCDIFNAPFVHESGRNVPSGYQVAQPLRRVGVDLVVVGRHISFLES